MAQCVPRGPKSIELFATNDQSLLKKWKIHPSVREIFDDRAKTNVYGLKGISPNPLMHWPKDKINAFDRPYPIIVFQIYIRGGTKTIIDIGLKFYNNLRRRITLSSNKKCERKDHLSAEFPLSFSKTEMWSHVIVDVEGLVASTWKEDILQNISSLSIAGVVNMKRIFSLRSDMICHTSETCWIKYEELPKQMTLSKIRPQSYLCISGSSHEIAIKNEASSDDRALKSRCGCTNYLGRSKVPGEFSHIYMDPSGRFINSTRTCLRNESSILNPGDKDQNEDLSGPSLSELIPLCATDKSHIINPGNKEQNKDQDFSVPTISNIRPGAAEFIPLCAALHKLKLNYRDVPQDPKLLIEKLKSNYKE